MGCVKIKVLLLIWRISNALKLHSDVLIAKVLQIRGLGSKTMENLQQRTQF